MIRRPARWRDALTASCRRLRRCLSGDERGQAVGWALLWPTMFVLTVLLVLHVFFANHARALAEVSASTGLRAGWAHGASPTASDDEVRLAAECAAWASLETPLYLLETVASPQPDMTCADWAARTVPGCCPASADQWRWFNPRHVRAAVDADTNTLTVLVVGEATSPLAGVWPSKLAKVVASACGPANLVAAYDQRAAAAAAAGSC